MSDLTMFAISRGALAALEGDQLLWSCIGSPESDVLELPDGVRADDVAVIDANMPSILLRDGRSFFWASDHWHPGATLERPAPPVAIEPREPRVFTEAPPEFGPAPELIRCVALRAFLFARGVETVAAGDYCDVTIERAAALTKSGSARIEDRKKYDRLLRAAEERATLTARRNAGVA